MKKKNPLVLSLLAFVSSLFLVWGYLKGKEAYLSSFEEPITVLIAKKDISKGSLLDEAFFSKGQVPKRFLQPGALLSFEEIKNKVAQAPILKGEQLLETKCVALGPESGLAVRIPAGMRALSLEVDEASGVASLIRPNNFVDLLATFETEESSDGSQTITQTIAQRVLVLTIDQDFDEENFKPARKQESDGEVFGKGHKKTATLALTPAQVQEVEFAKASGKISLSLRPQWEENTVEMQPTTRRVVQTKYREYRGR